MPVSAANSQVVFDALKASGVRLMSALPETWLVHLIRLADDDPDVTLVRLAKEEEGVGISMGAHFAGVLISILRTPGQASRDDGSHAGRRALGKRRDLVAQHARRHHHRRPGGRQSVPRERF